MKKKLGFILLNIICGMIAIKLSSVPVFHFIPRNSFWVSTAEEQRDYSLIYDICLGINLSSLFFIITESIPNYLRRKQGKKLVCEYINSLLSGMEFIFEVISACYIIDKPLSLEKLISINGNTKESYREISYCIEEYYISGKRKTGVHAYGSIDELIKNAINGIEHAIKNIKEYHFLYYDDIIFSRLMVQIETCSFIKCYSRSKNNYRCFILGDSDRIVSEFYQLFMELKNIGYNSEYSITTIDNIEKYTEYKNERESGSQIVKLYSYRSLLEKAYEEEKPIIIVKKENLVPKWIIDRIKDGLMIDKIQVVAMDEKLYERINDSNLIIDLTNEKKIRSKCFEEKKIFSFYGRYFPRSDQQEDDIYYYRKRICKKNIKESPNNNDIHRLTSGIREYLNEKYALNRVW